MTKAERRVVVSTLISATGDHSLVGLTVAGSYVGTLVNIVAPGRVVTEQLLALLGRAGEARAAGEFLCAKCLARVPMRGRCGTCVPVPVAPPGEDLALRSVRPAPRTVGWSENHHVAGGVRQEVHARSVGEFVLKVVVRGSGISWSVSWSVSFGKSVLLYGSAPYKLSPSFDVVEKWRVGCEKAARDAGIAVPLVPQTEDGLSFVPHQVNYPVMVDGEPWWYVTDEHGEHRAAFFVEDDAKVFRARVSKAKSAHPF
jgi:hypothetical protein